MIVCLIELLEKNIAPNKMMNKERYDVYTHLSLVKNHAKEENLYKLFENIM